MAEDIKRLNYFNGLFLKEEELKLEQDYHMRMRRLHNRYMHSHGIMFGLDVQTLSGVDTQVRVTPGMALDIYSDAQFGESSSRELVLAENFQVDLSGAGYADDAEVYIYISHAEDAIDVVQDRGGEQPIHLRERGVVSHSDVKPLDTSLNLLLGKVALVGGKVTAGSISFQENGEDLRIQAGFSGSSLSAERLTMRAAGANEGFAYLEGVLDASSNTGLKIDSNHTSLTGSLSVAGDLKGRVPLGGVMAVFDYGANIPVDTNAVTGDGFMLADGNTLPAGTTLYQYASDSGKSTLRPDCTNNVFIMGATVSGNTGGSNDLPAHTHSSDPLGISGQGGFALAGTVGDVPSGSPLEGHQHTYEWPHNSGVQFGTGAWVSRSDWDLLPRGSNTSGGIEDGVNQVQHTHDFSGTVTVDGLDVIGTLGAGSWDGDAGLGTGNMPNYISAIYLIRVD